MEARAIGLAPATISLRAPQVAGTAKPLLGIPDDVAVLAIVPFGYPAQPAGAGVKKRKPLGEVAHRERFGQPYV